jgi:chitodextrinase
VSPFHLEKQRSSPERGSWNRAGAPDHGWVVSAAGTRSLAAVLAALVAVLAVVGVASARDSQRRDRILPSAPKSLRVTSATTSSLVLAWRRSTDNIGVRGYYVTVEGERAKVPRRTYTATGLSCGASIHVRVVAFDRAGNRSRRTEIIASTAPCLDTEPPTAPTGMRQVATALDAVVLAWDPAADNVGVIGYGSYRGGLPFGSTPEPTLTLSGLSCGSTYTYDLDAVDASGNRSARTPVWVVTAACLDRDPPSTPTDLTVTDQTTSSLSVEWEPASDNVGVTRYRVSVDGRTARSVTGVNATVTGLACGTAYLFAIEAYDAADNRSPRSETRSATAPCAARPPSPDTTRPSRPRDLHVGSANETSISLLWSGSTDNVAVTAYVVYRNGSAAATVTQPSANVTGLFCGTRHRFEVEARDAAGNRSSRATVKASTTPCSDAQPPTAPSGVTATARTATSIALSWSPSSDNVGVVGYGLYQDAAPRTTTTGTSWVVSSLTCNTNYTLSVDAFDAAGNQSSKTTVMLATTACPDTSPPSAPSNLAVSGVTQTSLTLTWAPSADNLGVAGYDVYRNGTKVVYENATSSIQSGLPCGTSFAFGVEAVDAAGNRSTRSQLNASTGACPVSPPPPPSPSPPPPPPPPPPPSSDCTDTLSAGGDLSTFLSTLGPGDVGCLRAGEYTDGASVSWSTDAPASSRITLRSFPNETAVVHSEIHLGGDNLTLQGFTISNTRQGSCNAGANPTGCDAVRISGTGDHVLDMTLEGTGRHGVLFHTSSSNGMVARCLIRDIGTAPDTLKHGIYFNGNGHVVVNNVITDINAGYGIQLYPSSSNVTVAQNTVVGSEVRAGIVINTSGSGNVVVNNILASNAWRGINYVACSACTIDRNLEFGNGTSGGAVPGTIAANPQFIDSLFRVAATSPAVDAARADHSFSPAFGGVVRYRGSGPDLGAHER